MVEFIESHTTLITVIGAAGILLFSWKLLHRK